MKKLWSGRFREELDPSVLEYTHSVEADVRLLTSELWASLAHVMMLCYQDILEQRHGRLIAESLLELLDQASEGKLYLDKNLEDVHLNVENALISKLGLDVGGRIHTARSRNDQIATDTRLYLRSEVLNVQLELFALIESLLQRAQEETETLMVGFTHSQPAQPISVAYWLSAYASIFTRDVARLSKAYETVNVNPLGACAVAGTTFPVNRGLTSELLAFDDIVLHALDATSSRDFVIEVLAALSLVMSNLSRLAEELVLWSSIGMDLLEIGDSFATGSSIMPQKKNPVVAELARARTGRVYAALMHLLTLVKGLPMGYSCDLQEDKPLLWSALDITCSTVILMQKQVDSLTFNHERALDICWRGFTTATELANYLVVQHGRSFREAHQIVGQVVAASIRAGMTFDHSEFLGNELRKLGIHVDLDELKAIVDPVEAVRRQDSQGGTSPRRTGEIIAKLSKERDRQQQIAQTRAVTNDQALARTVQSAHDFVQGADIRNALRWT